MIIDSAVSSECIWYKHLHSPEFKNCGYNIFFCVLTQWCALHLCSPLSPAEKLRGEAAALCYCSSHNPSGGISIVCAAFWKPQALSCLWFRAFLSSYTTAILAAPTDVFWVSRQEVDFLRWAQGLQVPQSLLRTGKYLPVEIGGCLLNETRVWSYSQICVKVLF